MADAAAIARAAVAALRGDGQALVVAERGADPHVELHAVVDGRAGSAVARSAAAPDLARAAKQADLRARQMRALPAPPLPAGADDGEALPAFAPALHAPAADGDVELELVDGEAHVAVASTTGLVAAEARRWAAMTAAATTADGRYARASRWWVPADGTEAADAAAEVRALLGAGPAPGPLAAAVPATLAAIDAGPVRAVLGPEAVAVVLDALRGRFGVDAALGMTPTGESLGAAVVDLDDDAQHPCTLPRRLDVEGMPRQAVALLRAGRVAGAVRDLVAADRAGAASTGHATRPLTLAPLPEHLVLGAGDAPDVAALAEAVGDGVLLPRLDRTPDGLLAPGAARIEHGRITGALLDLRVTLDAGAVLHAVAALTRERRTVGLRGHAPGGPGALVTGALAAHAGVRVERGAHP